MISRRRERVATQELSLTYRGPALDAGRMPVRELAPALIALGDLFQIARELAEPNAPPVHLHVKGFSDGSFKTLLMAAIEGTGTVLLSNPAEALSNLITLIGDPHLGVFAVLKRIRGRITSVDQNSDGSTTITTENGDVYNFPSAQRPVFNILNESRGREAARAVLEPLLEEGVAEAEFDAPETGPLVLTATQVEVLDQFENAEPGSVEAEPIIDQVFEAFVSPVTASFDPKTKWRLQMGDQRISAKFNDEDHMEKFHRHEEGVFEDDTMVVDLRMRQWAPEHKKSIEWTIEKVKTHNHPGKTSEQLVMRDETTKDE